MSESESCGHLYQDIIVGDGSHAILGDHIVLNGQTNITIHVSENSAKRDAGTREILPQRQVLTAGHLDVIYRGAQMIEGHWHPGLNEFFSLTCNEATARIYISALICFFCGLLSQHVPAQRLPMAILRDNPRLAETVAVMVGLVISMCSIRMMEGPSISGDPAIQFEDAFGKLSLIPMEFFTSTHILKAFLKTRYEGSVAERFVDAENYSFRAGSEKGDVVDVVRLFQHNQMRRGSRFTMTVICELLRKECPDCNGTLEDLGSDTMQCNFCCRPLHRIFPIDAPSSINVPTTGPSGVPGLVNTKTQTTHLTVEDLRRDQDQNFRLGSLRHVDVHFQLRPHRSRGALILSMFRGEPWISAPPLEIAPRRNSGVHALCFWRGEMFGVRGFDQSPLTVILDVDCVHSLINLKAAKLYGDGLLHTIKKPVVDLFGNHYEVIGKTNIDVQYTPGTKTFHVPALVFANNPRDCDVLLGEKFNMELIRHLTSG